MLKTIADLSPQLIAFTLSRPQLRHVTRIADALITTEGSKTLSALYRNIVGDPCPKAAADTFREAPWTADDLRIPLRMHLIALVFKMAAAMGLNKHVFLSVDDSTTNKDKHSRRLQMVDWFIDLAEVVQAFHDAINDGDLDGAMALVADDARFELIIVLSGQAEIRDEFQFLINSNFNAELSDFQVEGDKVTFRVKATFDRPHEAVVEGGKIVSLIAF